MQLFKRLLQDEEGQGMAEYGLILALVALAVVATVGLLGGKLDTIFQNINGEIDKAITPATTTP